MAAVCCLRRYPWLLSAVYVVIHGCCLLASVNVHYENVCMNVRMGMYVYVSAMCMHLCVCVRVHRVSYSCSIGVQQGPELAPVI